MSKFKSQRRPAGGAGRGIFTNLVDPDPNNPYAKTFKVGHRAKVMGENLRLQRYPFIAPNVITRQGEYIIIEEGEHETELVIDKDGDQEFATFKQTGDGGEKTFKLLPLKAKAL